jgi:hypothetical protein
MQTLKRFYTYAYLREDRTPYYIGKGKGKRAYYKKKSEGLRVPKDKNRIIFLKQNLTEEEAFKHEIYMIFVFGRKDLGTGILHNRTDGGDGTSGRCWSDETRQKLSIAHTGKILSNETKRKLSELNSGKTLSQETKDRISSGLKGIVRTEETKEKIRLSRIGTKRTEETRKRLSEIVKNRNPEVVERMRQTKCKKQYQLEDEDGNLYVTNNIRLFCIENNLNHGAVYQLINQKIKSYKGWTGKIL